MLLLSEAPKPHIHETVWASILHENPLVFLFFACQSRDAQFQPFMIYICHLSCLMLYFTSFSGSFVSLNERGEHTWYRTHTGRTCDVLCFQATANFCSMIRATRSCAVHPCFCLCSAPLLLVTLFLHPPTQKILPSTSE